MIILTSIVYVDVRASITITSHQMETIQTASSFLWRVEVVLYSSSSGLYVGGFKSTPMTAIKAGGQIRLFYRRLGLLPCILYEFLASWTDIGAFLLHSSVCIVKLEYIMMLLIGSASGAFKLFSWIDFHVCFFVKLTRRFSAPCCCLACDSSLRNLTFYILICRWRLVGLQGGRTTKTSSFEAITTSVTALGIVGRLLCSDVGFIFGAASRRVGVSDGVRFVFSFYHLVPDWKQELHVFITVLWWSWSSSVWARDDLSGRTFLLVLHVYLKVLSWAYSWSWLLGGILGSFSCVFNVRITDGVRTFCDSW
jgi:hypothetical protein